MRETLPVLYRDERLIAVHKPSGLLIHRSNIDRHETRFALQIVRDQTGRHVHAVHRLDKGTSGVLLFAFDPEAASILGGGAGSGFQGCCDRLVRRLGLSRRSIAGQRRRRFASRGEGAGQWHDRFNLNGERQ